VVNPPDGDMSDYIDSLDKLATACADHDLEFILPAHGYVLANAAGAVAHLKAHRLQREAKVAAAMRQLPDGSPDDWVRLAYDDVPERMWPVAARSLLAHVQRIQAQGGFNA
jgi:recombination protein RecT